MNGIWYKFRLYYSLSSSNTKTGAYTKTLVDMREGGYKRSEILVLLKGIAVI